MIHTCIRQIEGYVWMRKENDEVHNSTTYLAICSYATPFLGKTSQLQPHQDLFHMKSNKNLCPNPFFKKQTYSLFKLIEDTLTFLHRMANPLELNLINSQSN